MRNLQRERDLCAQAATIIPKGWQWNTTFTFNAHCFDPHPYVVANARRIIRQGHP